MNDGVHLPVLLDEAVAALAINPQGIYVDATFGRGGHARAILAALSPRGRLIGIDRDPAAQRAAEELALADTRFAFRRAWFSQLPDVLADLVGGKADGVLLDLGVSSPQIDDRERGFSFQNDGPLDMRMDPTRGESVADFLRRARIAELTEVIREYGEERYAPAIAKAIVAARARAPVVRTRQLAEIVGAAAGARTRGDWRQDPATRTFQALRIFANQELTEVRQTLPFVVTALATGGRCAVISFHSLEDRIVKRFFARAAQPYAGDAAVARLAIRASALPGAPLTLIGRARRPSPAEIARNPRSRSATLRVAERTEHPMPPHWPRGYLDDAR